MIFFHKKSLFVLQPYQNRPFLAQTVFLAHFWHFGSETFFCLGQKTKSDFLTANSRAVLGITFFLTDNFFFPDFFWNFFSVIISTFNFHSRNLFSSRFVLEFLPQSLNHYFFDRQFLFFSGDFWNSFL